MRALEIGTVQTPLFAEYRAVQYTGIDETQPGKCRFEGRCWMYNSAAEARDIELLTTATRAIDVGASDGFFTLPFAEWAVFMTLRV